MFLMMYLEIFFKVQTSFTAHYVLPRQTAAIVKEIPRGGCAAVAAASGVVVVVMPGNKSKMDFPGAVWLVASSGSERKHLPVYSRLAVTRQPSSDRLARHESCSAPSVIRPYVLNARVCTCVRVRRVWVSTCAHDTAVPTCLPPPTHRRTSSSIASPLPLSFRPLNLPVPSFLPSFLASSPFPSAPNSKRMRREEEPAFLRRNTDVRASVSRSSTWNTACPRTGDLLDL